MLEEELGTPVKLAGDKSKDGALSDRSSPEKNRELLDLMEERKAKVRAEDRERCEEIGASVSKVSFEATA